MKIACASDIHGRWAELDYPNADILILAGDILSNYFRDRETDARMQMEELASLDSFMKEMTSYKDIILISGNHEFCTLPSKEEQVRKICSNMHYLRDEAKVIQGKKIYGSPWQPHFFSWNFNFPDPKDNAARARAHAVTCWDMIPNDTEILITHGPSYSVLDCVPPYLANGRDPHVGCPHLLNRVKTLPNLQLHVVGHIHSGYGQVRKDDWPSKPLVVNGSVCTEDYEPINPIQVVEI